MTNSDGIRWSPTVYKEKHGQAGFRGNYDSETSLYFTGTLYCTCGGEEEVTSLRRGAEALQKWQDHVVFRNILRKAINDLE